MSVEKLKVSLGVYDAQWEANLELYKAFKAEHGREPSVSEVYHGKNLGTWCKVQRDFFHKGTLSAERWKKLTVSGFAFGLFEKAWQDSFQAYVEFKAEHGREPSFSGQADEKVLARWCLVQRRAYKSSTLLAEREQLLLDAGFVFKQQDARWQNNLALYVAFKEEYGREPAREEVYHDVNIGLWCKTQRDLYHKGTLSEERWQKLTDTGFGFDRKRQYGGSLEDKIVDATERSNSPRGESDKLVSEREL